MREVVRAWVLRSAPSRNSYACDAYVNNLECMNWFLSAGHDVDFTPADFAALREAINSVRPDQPMLGTRFANGDLLILLRAGFTSPDDFKDATAEYLRTLGVSELRILNLESGGLLALWLCKLFSCRRMWLRYLMSERLLAVCIRSQIAGWGGAAVSSRASVSSTPKSRHHWLVSFHT